MYHLLQTQHEDLWLRLKKWSLETKEHVFLLMYPEEKDVQMIFEDQKSLAKPDAFVKLESWDEGVAIGLTQPQNDRDVQSQIEQIEQLLQSWMQQQKSHEITI